MVSGRPGIGIGFGEEAVDGGLEFDDRTEHAVLEPPPRQFREEALDGIEPGAGFRGEVEDEARMPRQPSPHLGMFVSGIVVDDHVDQLTDWRLGLDRVEETDELLMPVTLHAAANHLALDHVESGKQCGRVVPCRL